MEERRPFISGDISMQIRDTPRGYGLISRILHWGMAAALFALFGLGWWMTGLDYYSPYYKSAPDLHRSAGILFLAALLLRAGWRLANVKPGGAGLSPFERRAARIVHTAFYPLLLILALSGYLISTADGRAIDVFGWFKVPAILEWPGLEDTAGLLHKWIAYAVVSLALIHAAAAVKHRIAGQGPSRHRMWSGPGPAD
jgi:cytochrome b561